MDEKTKFVITNQRCSACGSFHVFKIQRPRFVPVGSLFYKRVGCPITGQTITIQVPPPPVC